MCVQCNKQKNIYLASSDDDNKNNNKENHHLLEHEDDTTKHTSPYETQDRRGRGSRARAPRSPDIPLTQPQRVPKLERMTIIESISESLWMIEAFGNARSFWFETNGVETRKFVGT